VRPRTGAALGHRTSRGDLYRVGNRVRPRSNPVRMVGPVTPHSDRWRSVTVTHISERTPVARAKLHEVARLDTPSSHPDGDVRTPADRIADGAPDAPSSMTCYEALAGPAGRLQGRGAGHVCAVAGGGLWDQQGAVRGLGGWCSPQNG
jgi:hypothetical protein